MVEYINGKKKQLATTTNTYTNRPGVSNDGDLFLPSDGYGIERDTGAAWTPWGPIFPFDLTAVPTTWVNQGAASIDIAKGGHHLSIPSAAGYNIAMRKKATPSTPYVIEVAFLPLMYHDPSANPNPLFGVGWRQSSDGKLILFSLGMSLNPEDFKLSVFKFTNATTWAASYASVESWQHALGFPYLMKIEDNTTNRICSIGTDGQHWLPVHTVGRTDYLTANEVFFFVTPGSSSGGAAMTLLSWKES